MIEQLCTEEQKADYLPRMATGELRSAYSMTEPHAGSDVQAIRTRAVREGGEWVLNWAERCWSRTAWRACRYACGDRS